MNENPQRQVKQGEIYWAEIPKRDESAAGVAHPHLVLQDDLFNLSRESKLFFLGIFIEQNWLQSWNKLDFDLGVLLHLLEDKIQRCV